MSKLKEMELEKLNNLYSMVTEICSEYSKMTDNYSLATGDSTFQSMPDDIRRMIEKRQKFFEYRERIKAALIEKIEGIMA